MRDFYTDEILFFYIFLNFCAGFDYEKAKQALNISDEYTFQAMAAIGKQGTKKSLPEHIQKVEVPSTRKAVDEIAFEGTLPK